MMMISSRSFLAWMIIGNFLSANAYEISASTANHFLHSHLSDRLTREKVESQRESCLDEYQQQTRNHFRRPSLSTVCAQYCNETSDCQESSACVNPTWPARLMRHVQKIGRMCYIRFTKVLRYDQAEELCQQNDAQMAVIDNLQLLQQLRDSNMFNVTCKGQCPTAKGYYIGLRRMTNEEGTQPSTWIWSNNETWMENDTCDPDVVSSMPHARLLCYTAKDGKRLTAWNRGEPNNGGFAGSLLAEACVEIIADTGVNSIPEQIGHLNDIPCYKPTLGVLCQRKDTKPVNETQFQSFASVIGFNSSVKNEEDPLMNLFSNFNGSIAASLDALAEMAAALENLLALPSFTPNQANNVLNVVDQVVDVTDDVVTDENALKPVTNKLLNFLDRFPAKIESTTKDSMSFDYTNLNISVVDIQPTVMKDEWLTLLSATDDAPVIIEINQRVLHDLEIVSDQYRVIQTIFTNFNLFPQPNQTHVGRPISYQIANYTQIYSTEDLIRFQIRVPPDPSMNLSCAFWSFGENNGSWIIDDGCRFLGYRDDYAQCICNHLTHFALLIVIASDTSLNLPSKVEELVLTSITYLGLGLSVLGLLLTLITFGLFRRLRRNHLHKSLIMLSVSLLIVDLLYIPFHLIKPNSFPFEIVCSLLGFLFHYFFLASFMWMLIMAIVQYLHFVRVFDSHISHFFLKTSLVAWVFPLLFPFTVYISDYNRAYLGHERCWIENGYLLYGTFVFPIALILISNCVLFGFILKSICHHNTSVVHQQKNQSKLQLGAAVCCFVSMGCTWFVGLLVFLQPSFLHQLIFCLCNAFQGFFIFVFHVYLSKAKRELWQLFFLDRGLRQRPTMSISQSRSGPISTLVPPVKFRFSANSSSQDQITTVTPVPIRLNPSYA